MNDVKTQYVRSAIEADANFAVSSILSFGTSNASPMAIISHTPFLALFLYESRKTLDSLGGDDV